MNKQALVTLLAGATLGTLATAAVTATRADEAAAMPAGTTKPSLDALVADIEQKHGGRVTEIELERRPWGDHYEMELSGADFREWDIVVNARTGKIRREHRDFD